MNRIIYYDENNMKLGERECPDYRLSVNFVAEHFVEFCTATNAVYLAHKENEFHLYHLYSDGKTFQVELIQ